MLRISVMERGFRSGSSCWNEKVFIVVNVEDAFCFGVVELLLLFLLYTFNIQFKVKDAPPHVSDFVLILPLTFEYPLLLITSSWFLILTLFNFHLYVHLTLIWGVNQYFHYISYKNPRNIKISTKMSPM